MRIVFAAAFIANLVLLAVSYALLPDRVALHFGGGGLPNDLGSKEVYVAVFFGTTLFSFALFWCIPLLMRITPDSLLNLPHKEYWLSDENRPKMLRRLRDYMDGFGAVLFVFLFWVELLCLRAHFVDPIRLNEPAMFWGLGAFLVYTVYFCVKPLWLFRPPKRK